MIYRSNLHSPNLRPFFKLASPSIVKLGHDVPSDPDFDPNCGFLTDDEGAILYHIAKAWPKRWVDIGARFGWSTAHIAVGSGREVMAVDPELKNDVQLLRFCQNRDSLYESQECPHCGNHLPSGNGGSFCFSACASEPFFEIAGQQREGHAWLGHYDAAHIDGDHDAPQPTLDAIRAMDAGAKVLVFHDFSGKPIRDAVTHVIDPVSNWKARIYWTPNLMAVCWQEGCGFVPPDHVRDPAIDWSGMERIVAEDFDVSRCR
jgi:hypothetical protein